MTKYLSFSFYYLQRSSEELFSCRHIFKTFFIYLLLVFCILLVCKKQNVYIYTRLQYLYIHIISSSNVLQLNYCLLEIIQLIYIKIIDSLQCIFRLKFDTSTNSNMLNLMVMFTFSVFDLKYSFWAKLAQKIKIVSLSRNLVLRLIRTWCTVTYCWYQSTKECSTS